MGWIQRHPDYNQAVERWRDPWKQWEKRLITYRGSSLSVSADFSSALISAQNLLKLWGLEGSDLVYGGLVANSCPTLATPWTVACQSPLSTGFSRQLHSTGVGYHFLLQGIFPSQKSSMGLLHCRQILCQLGHQGSPIWCIQSAKIKKKQQLSIENLVSGKTAL